MGNNRNINAVKKSGDSHKEINAQIWKCHGLSPGLSSFFYSCFSSFTDSSENVLDVNIFTRDVRYIIYFHIISFDFLILLQTSVICSSIPIQGKYFGPVQYLLRIFRKFSHILFYIYLRILIFYIQWIILFCFKIIARG